MVMVVRDSQVILDLTDFEKAIQYSYKEGPVIHIGKIKYLDISIWGQKVKVVVTMINSDK